MFKKNLIPYLDLPTLVPNSDYRTRVISTRGYYFFRGFLLRALFESGYYSRACTIWKLSYFKLENGQIHVKIAILQPK